jgi:hypothetical protein
MMNLARRSLRTRRMMLERMMVMMVKLHHACILYFHYDDYGAGWSIPYTSYDPARSSGSSYLIIHPQESSATSMSIRHGRGPEMLLTVLIQLLLLPLSRKTLDTLYLILIG